jgi:hypothetical protein
MSNWKYCIMKLQLILTSQYSQELTSSGPAESISHLKPYLYEICFIECGSWFQRGHLEYSQTQLSRKLPPRTPCDGKQSNFLSWVSRSSRMWYIITNILKESAHPPNQWHSATSHRTRILDPLPLFCKSLRDNC